MKGMNQRMLEQVEWVVDTLELITTLVEKPHTLEQVLIILGSYESMINKERQDHILGMGTYKRIINLEKEQFS